MDIFKGAFGALQAYDGTSDPAEFFRQFELQAMIFNWDDNKKIQVIQFFLVKKAKRIFDAISEDDKKAFSKIKEQITKGCNQSQEALLDAFYNRKPAPNELLSHFALSLQELLSKAIPSMGDTEKTILLRSQRSQHLPEHMRALIQFNASKSWDELLRALDKSMPHVRAHAATASYQTTAQSPTFDYEVKHESVDITTSSHIRIKRSNSLETATIVRNQVIA